MYLNEFFARKKSSFLCLLNFFSSCLPGIMESLKESRLYDLIFVYWKRKHHQCFKGLGHPTDSVLTMHAD